MPRRERLTMHHIVGASAPDTRVSFVDATHNHYPDRLLGARNYGAATVGDALDLARRIQVRVVFADRLRAGREVRRRQDAAS